MEIIMANIKIDFQTTVGKMKPVHGVGQPPFAGMNFSMFHYLTEAGIPFSRLHDVGGAYARGVFVDIPNIFRDFDADPSLPESYDFAFTDELLKALDAAGVEPWYRLGVTIENYQMINAYHIFPPRDYLKWARICEGIIRHYTEGWADGFHFNIRYWEIWNEPENGIDQEHNAMWKGSMEDYYELYGTASRYLKEKFPHLKFGGYAACGFYYLMRGDRTDHPYGSKRAKDRMDYLEAFLEYVKQNNCPLDFFSWHSYEDNPDYNVVYADYVRERLDAHGFTETESSLNEWNPKTIIRGTAEHAALTAANLILMQRGTVDTAMFYDARWGIGHYTMFHPYTAEPLLMYYAFLYFNQLYQLEEEAAVETDSTQLKLCAAGKGEKGAVLLANYSGEALPLTLDMPGFTVTSCRVVDENYADEELAFSGSIENNCVMLLTVERVNR